jgi:phospholipase/carboxylesterase
VPIQRLDLAGLTTRIIGDHPLTVVLLHGFGAPGDDLVSLASLFDAPVRFVFPEAPLELSGFGASRAWWMLDLAQLEMELARGQPRDRSAEIPDGLPAARAQMLRFLDMLQARFSIADDHLVVGGFSQGAMLALDVSLHRPHAPAALALMSTTIIAETDWTPRYANLANVPIVQSHGRHDMLLPFAVAESLRDKLRAAGATVDWHPFLGGHEIPPAVLEALGSLLAKLA